MYKKEIKVNINDFPSELHYLFDNAQIYDSSSHPSMKVLYSDLGYYIKIAEKNMLLKEAKMTQLFENNNIGVELISYISNQKDYMVTKSAVGEDSTHYLNNPERLCEVLADTMRFLHSKSIENLPISPCMELYEEKGYHLKYDTFIHGDFCLPNIILNNWKFTSFIDVGFSGLGDKHIDLYWILWSLNFNLKTEKYNDYFLKLYGKDNYDEKILKIVTEVEENA